MAVPYHTHTFEIPAATKDDVIAGVSTDKAVTPSSLGSSAVQNVEDFATAEQGRKADTAVQPGDLAKVATTGEYQDLKNLPALGSASSHSEMDFATAHQGRVADTAVQPGDLAGVATSGEYNDLKDRPQLGTASSHDVGEFATAAQGQKANTAVQPSMLGTAANHDASDFATSAQGNKADTAVQPDDLGSAAAHGSGDFATAAQGVKADSAVQPGSLKALAYKDKVAISDITASGTASDTTFLAGDGSWKVPAGGGSGSDRNEVLYDPQTLTSEQQGQVLSNIGASGVAGYRNKLINGGFQVNTFGTGSGAWPMPAQTKTFVADRWYCENNTDVDIFATAASNQGIPSKGAFFTAIANSPASTGDFLLSQRIEGVNTLAGEIATASFFMSSATQLSVEVFALQDFDGRGTNVVRIDFGTHSIAGDNQIHKVTAASQFPVLPDRLISDDNIKWVVRFLLPTTVKMDITLWRASLVAGDATSDPDPFEPRHYQQELALCRRYTRRYASNPDLGDLGKVMRTTPTKRTDGNNVPYYDAEFAP